MILVGVLPTHNVRHSHFYVFAFLANFPASFLLDHKQDVRYVADFSDALEPTHLEPTGVVLAECRMKIGCNWDRYGDLEDVKAHSYSVFPPFGTG